MFPRCILILLLVASSDYQLRIEREREERNELFRDPQRSPLATSAIRLLDKPEIVFGSSSAADFVWKDSSVKPLHLKILRGPDSIRVEELQGKIYSVPEGRRIHGLRWEVDDLLEVGEIMLVLQVHPVGPVVRVIDRKSTGFVSFEGLDYFPVDPEYRVEGEIRPGKLRETMIVDTQGWTRTGWVYGRIHFKLSGTEHSLDLIAFDRNPSAESEFMLIFQDETSGRETYPACRYLYIPYTPRGTVWIDFNRALNPSCAYGDGFACPLPLPGNRLAVPVPAGEKNFHRDH